MEEVIQILMKRDGMSRAEAKNFLDGVMREIEDAIANGDHELAKDIWIGDVGLEIDYLMEVLL